MSDGPTPNKPGFRPAPRRAPLPSHPDFYPPGSTFAPDAVPASSFSTPATAAQVLNKPTAAQTVLNPGAPVTNTSVNAGAAAGPLPPSAVVLAPSGNPAATTPATTPSTTPSSPYPPSPYNTADLLQSARQIEANAGTSVASGAGGYGKIGQIADPVAPLSQGSGAVVAYKDPNTGKNVQSVVQGGDNVTGESGIKDENGNWVTHDAKGNRVAASPTQYAAPLTREQQMAKAIEAYPQLGVAGTAQNKAFVDAWTKAGRDDSNILGMAHSMFAPKTQAQAVAQDKTSAQFQQQQQSQAQAADKAALQAARTPEQVAADNQKQQSQREQVANAGKSTYDPDNTAQNVGRAVGDTASTVFNTQNLGGAVDDYYSNPSTIGGGIVSGVKNFVSGLTGGGSTPATPATPAVVKTHVNGAVDPQSGQPLVPAARPLGTNTAPPAVPTGMFGTVSGATSAPSTPPAPTKLSGFPDGFTPHPDPTQPSAPALASTPFPKPPPTPATATAAGTLASAPGFGADPGTYGATPTTTAPRTTYQPGGSWTMSSPGFTPTSDDDPTKRTATASA